MTGKIFDKIVFGICLAVWSLLLLMFFGCARPFQGEPGAPGGGAEPCTVTAVDGGALISCPDGTTQTVYNGRGGPTGASGPSGGVGPQGAAGAPGTVITVVQFCTGYAYHYPSTFPELGICWGGNLYAVYDGGGNDVFLSLIPPGRYSSTSTSAPCDFAVGAGCEVTHD